MRKCTNHLAVLLPLALSCSAAPVPVLVVLLADQSLDAPAVYGLETLQESLVAKGVLVERVTDLTAAKAVSWFWPAEAPARGSLTL